MGRGLGTGWGFLGALLAAMTAAIVLLNHGFFTYTLDDAYIHLSLAENLLRGHYGVNPGELAAPSSSALWPLLLAPFQAARFGTGGMLAPLVLNVAAAFAAVAVFHALLVRALGKARPDGMRALLLVLLITAANLTGLVFTGMEHTLQVLLTATAALGLVIEAREARLPAWLPVALVLGPLVRYENLAITLPALFYLASRKRLTAALGTGAVLAVLLGGFSAGLMRLGLHALPTSVLFKSGMDGGGSALLPAFLARAQELVRHDPNVYLTLTLLLLIARAVFPGEPGNRSLAATAAAAVALHLGFAGGLQGAFHRYEASIWVFALLMLIPLYRAPLAKTLDLAARDARSRLKFAALAILLTGAVCARTLIETVFLPLTAHDIYGQQYQLHRFAAEAWRQPAAINDLGWVSYRNENYILDLWGLASPEALRHHRARLEDLSWMDVLARRRNVRLAMVYDKWFPGGFPSAWIRVGELRREARLNPGGGSRVAFYATDTAALAEVSAKLREFRKTLPADARFVFTGEDPAFARDLTGSAARPSP